MQAAAWAGCRLWACEIAINSTRKQDWWINLLAQGISSCCSRGGSYSGAAQCRLAYVTNFIDSRNLHQLWNSNRVLTCSQALGFVTARLDHGAQLNYSRRSWVLSNAADGELFSLLILWSWQAGMAVQSWSCFQLNAHLYRVRRWIWILFRAQTKFYSWAVWICYLVHKRFICPIHSTCKASRHISAVLAKQVIRAGTKLS